MFKSLLLVSSLVFIASCNSESSNGKVEGVFSDSAVTNFQQTSGIANNNFKENVLEIAIPKAHAGIGSISCLKGEAVGFSMDAFGNSIDVSSTCSAFANIEKDIRVQLLKSMTGLKIRRTVTEATYNGNDAFLDFTSGFQFDVGYDVPRNGGLPCVETYTFRSNGTVVISATDQTGLGAGCGGASSDEISFQFKNGYLEFDLSSQRNFNTSHTTDDEGSQVGAYERFEVCNGSNTISTDTLPTSVGDDNTNLSANRDSVATNGQVVPCN